MKHAYWRPIRKLKGQPWDVKKQRADISSKRHAWINLSFWSSMRCNCVQWRNQYVPLNKTCKKVFGWHLLKTISFLLSQITGNIKGRLAGILMLSLSAIIFFKKNFIKLVSESCHIFQSLTNESEFSKIESCHTGH